MKSRKITRQVILEVVDNQLKMDDPPVTNLNNLPNEPE